MRCKKRVPTNTLMPIIQAGVIPSCLEPNCRGVLKPEITFFGEILDDKVSTTITKDRLQADLLLVIGTSLKVAPVMEIPGYLPSHIPQVVINKTVLKKKRMKSRKLSTGGEMSRISRIHGDGDAIDDEEEFDLSLLGDCDDIIRYLCSQAGWHLDAKAIEAAKKKKPVSLGRQVILHQYSCGKRVFCFGECQCKNTLAADNNDDEEEENDEEEELEDDIVCNRCEERIDTDAEPGSSSKTIHYRCNDCFDYDLCGDCYPKRRYKHKGGRHRFTQRL
ncbi:unnamed protein product [Peronospora destructor]|nr:unnamed protein product [Peronospora destructor]